MSLLMTVVVGASVLVLAWLYRHLTRRRGHLEKLGIPVIPPFGLLGSPPFALNKLLLHEHYVEEFNKYGKTYGRYEGVKPTIVTKDPEIVKSVTQKNFDSFNVNFDMILDDKTSTLDATHGEVWKSLRKGLSPTFTSGRLKAMMEPLSDVSDHMMGYVDEVQKKDDVVDMKPIFQGLSINAIARCAFGVEADAWRNPDLELLRYAKESFSAFTFQNWVFILFYELMLHFPGVETLLPLMPPALYKVYDITVDIMNQRKKLGIETNDFLQRLEDLKKSVHDDPSSFPGINDEIVNAQGIIFILAGYETTANTLSTFTYNLAKHPDIQEKVYQEIKEVLANVEDPNNQDTLKDMVYLEAALSENLRMFGPATFHMKVCTKDCEVIPGMHVKKGWQIFLPIYASHHDEDFFPEPKVFRPERFFKDNIDSIIPFTYRPFGGGPRLCIGQRFAMNEMKVAMVKLLMKYRLEATEDTKLDFEKGNFGLLGYPEIKVKLVKRESS